MNTITIEEFTDRIRQYNVEGEDGIITNTARPEIIKCRGKPTLIRAFYNNRYYTWELVE